MGERHKVLLVDDDQDLLDLYREILSQLPSRPEIMISSTGAKAMAMMEAEPYTLLVCDLNMPKMDGLQVLSIVRRKYPELRTVVLTSVMDEQFRSRVYGLGVDLFWQKPATGDEIKQFLECIESLLGRETQSGFRGVQSKSLVDIIQLECLSQNSTVLKIINGPLVGRIWIQGGDVIDAQTGEFTAEAAFQKILSWRAGNFETLPAEPNRTRTIFSPYQGLLLETAQAHDEAQVEEVKRANATGNEGDPNSPLAVLARFDGVESVMRMDSSLEKGYEARGVDNPEPLTQWMRENLERFRDLGERLQAGLLIDMDCLGQNSHVTVCPTQKGELCVGWRRGLSVTEARESMKKLLALWVS